MFPAGTVKCLYVVVVIATTRLFSSVFHRVLDLDMINFLKMTYNNYFLAFDVETYMSQLYYLFSFHSFKLKLFYVESIFNTQVMLLVLGTTVLTSGE